MQALFLWPTLLPCGVYCGILPLLKPLKLLLHLDANVHLAWCCGYGLAIAMFWLEFCVIHVNSSGSLTILKTAS